MADPGTNNDRTAGSADDAGRGMQPLSDVVARWLDATCAGERQRREALLDRAVRDTYPASDPIAPQTGQGADDAVLEVECHMAQNRLTLTARLSSDADNVSRIVPDPIETLEAEGPAGIRLRVKVYGDTPSSPEPVPAPGRSSEHDIVDRPGVTDSQAGGAGASVDWPAVERRLAERRGSERRNAAR